MKRLASLATAVLILVAIALSVVALNRSKATQQHTSALDRVLKTGTLRVGYVNYPPGTIVDPKTGHVSGIFPDLTRQLGKDLDLKVEFTEEVGWATLIEGLKTGRYDIIGGLWANPERGRYATVSTPVYYSGIGVWTRPKETRVSSANNWTSLNSPGITIGAIDGSTPLEIIHDQFPNAHLVTYPNLTTEPQLFVDLATKKIDVFLAEPSQGIQYLSKNPGTVINQAADHPIRVFADVFLMPSDEPQFKNMIDTALFDLQSRGITDQLVDKYQVAPGAFYRTATPYVGR
jgi:polar amino acid transport system substrate-binding protein